LLLLPALACRLLLQLLVLLGHWLVLPLLCCLAFALVGRTPRSALATLGCA
jgi:hypothetical protein